MTTNEIEHVKLIGIVEKLRSEISGQLWHAKKKLDEASNHNFNTFNEKVEEAEEFIQSAAQLVKEYCRASGQLTKLTVKLNKDDAPTN